MLLRFLIKDVNDISYESCIVRSDICNENVEKMMPEELHNFLFLLITGKSQDSLDENNSHHANILAVAHDIICMTSSKRCKTPKDVALATAIKHLTGSKMIINILNKLGHCICYDDVMGIQTAVANDIISKMPDEGWFVPSNIFAGSFVHAVAANIDINEEIKSGEGTTHVLGSVIYQAKRDNAPLTYIWVIASDTRIRAVKNLTMFNLRDASNTHQN